MAKYRVKVVEKHSDYVWVEAENDEQAKEMAYDYSHCEFECLYDCEIVSKEEDCET